MTKIKTFSYPTDIRFGSDASVLLAPELKQQGLVRPLIVTDHFLASTKMIKDLVATLEQDQFRPHVFSGVAGNPIEAQVIEGVNAFTSASCDAIVAIGGGASIDVAKAIGLLTKNDGQLSDYDDVNPHKKNPANPVPFLVAIPTTAGTGSEVGRSTVISHDQTKQKMIICHSYLLPKLVLADPKLTLDLPPAITSATGMDALTHHVEAYLVNDFHPMCDGIALSGLHLLSMSLTKAFKAAKSHDHSDEAISHRANVLCASMMGAVAFQKGLGLNHSIAHALSTVCDLHHGLANAVVLPHVVKFNARAASAKYDEIARVLNVSPSQSIDHFIGQLNDDLEIVNGLKNHGVSEKHIDHLVEVAFKDGCHLTNPQPVSKDDIRKVIINAL